MTTVPSLDRPPRFAEHPYRQLIAEETHARPVLPLVAPLRVRRLAFMSADGGADLAAVHKAMTALSGGAGDGPAWARQIGFAHGGRQVTFELHNEFATLTWTGPADDWDARPEGIGLDLHAKLLLVSATRIDVMPAAQVAEAALGGFSPLSLCYSAIFEGTAEAAGDFHRDADGFVRFEIAVGGNGTLRAGIIVRRLLEIETYRTMALLGLPLARELSGQVSSYEARLATIMQRIAVGDSAEAHQSTLAALHGLSTEIGRTVEATSFRFAATQAYGDVLAERLERLKEQPIGEFTTIERFVNNRAQPALATCRAMDKRLAALTLKVQRSIELLDARISLSIQTQNQSVLDAISATSKSQYRLQETVEGLSIIAISYYALGILGYVFEGLHDLLPVTKGTAMALSAPFVLAGVFFGIRRLRRLGHPGRSAK